MVTYCFRNMGKDIYSITAKHLVRILSDPKFKRNVQELGDLECPNEKSFAILQMKNSSEYIVGDVEEGSDDCSHGEGPSAFDFGLEYGDGQDSYFLFALHSHPTGNVTPSIIDESGGDLLALSNMRENYAMYGGLAVRPIEGVVGSVDGKTIHILLIQEKTKTPLAVPFLRDYEDLDWRYDAKPEEIARILEETKGYNAIPITMHNKRLLFSDGLIDKLKKFEFSPTLTTPTEE